MKIRLPYYLLFSVFGITKNTSEESSSTQKIDNFQIRGCYTENPDDLQHLIDIRNSDKLLCLGTIKEIKWPCTRFPLEEVSKLFPEFTTGKTVNPITLKYILFFLEQQFKLKYEFKLRYKKSKPNEVIIVLQEKNNQKYIINKITIKGNKILSTDDILSSISPVIAEINLIEKIKFLIFKESGAVVVLENLKPSIEYCVKALGDKRLLLDVKTSVDFIKNDQNATVHVIITIEEGAKYFIKKIQYNEGENVINKRHLRIWINQYGLSKMDEFFKNNNILNLECIHNIEDIFLNLVIDKKPQSKGRIVHMVRYSGFENISLEYIVKNIPVHIGQHFNEQKMKEFIEEQCQNLSAKITYTTYYSREKELTIHMKMEKNNIEQKIMSSDDRNNPILQYTFVHQFYSHPHWHLTLTPKLKINVSMANVQPGLMAQLEYRWLNRSLNFINGDSFLNISESSHFLRSLNIRFLNLSNVNKKYISWSVTPLILTKYYNPIMHEDTMDHIYKYMNISLRKIDIFGESVRRFKMSNNINFSYFYGRNFKCNFTTHFLIPLTKKIHFHTSCKVILTNHTMDPHNKDIFFHLEMINGKEEAYALLWNTHLLPSELHILNLPTTTMNYLNSKKIILSNCLFNMRFMLNYVIFKTEFPGFGKIQLIFFLFYNKVFDISNDLHRDSCGLGFMGVYNNNAILLSLGKKMTQKGFVNDENLDYGISFEQYVL